MAGKEGKKANRSPYVPKNLMHCSDCIKEIGSGKGGNAEGCVVAIAHTGASWNRAKMR